MKQLIRQILDEYRSRWNTDSINVKEVITDSELDSVTDAIVNSIESNDLSIENTAEGWADAHDVDEVETERKKWICSLCGKSTFEVDWDYIGSGYNHLGCELEIEMKNDRRRKNSLQRKHEEKVFGGDTGIDADFHYGGDDIGDGHNSKQLHEDEWMEEDIFKMEDIPVILDNIREQEKREKENKK